MPAGKQLYVEVVGNVTGLVSQLGIGAAAVEDFGRKANVAGNTYSKALKDAEASSRGFVTAGKGLVVTGGLIAAGLAVAVKKYMDFSSVMATNQALLRSSTTSTAELNAQMSQLSDAAKTAGVNIGYSAVDVANAEQELIKAGISVQDILGGALKGSLDLAAAGQEDVAAATNTAAIAMTQFKLKGADVPHIADLLAAGADRALGSVADLSKALNYGGTASAQAGQSLENTVGTLAELAQNGQLGSRAGMELGIMLRDLEKPSTAAQKVMDQYGISVYDANGNMLSFTQIAGELQDKLGSLPPAQQNAALATMFTSNAVRAATILMRGGAQANQQWTDTVNVQGFAALQAAGKMNSLSGDVAKFKAQLDNALIDVGGTGASPLRGLVQDGTEMLSVWNQLPGPIKDVAVGVTAMAGAVALLGGAALLLIPRWAAMNAALAETRVGAISASSALTGIGKATVAVGLIVGIGEAAHSLGQSFMHDAVPSVDAMTSALVNLDAHTGASGDALLAYVRGVGSMGNTFGTGAKMLTTVDAALAGLVTSGHLPTANADFNQISQTLKAAGWSTTQITAAFPELSSALADSGTSAKVAGTGIDQYGNAVSAAAQKAQNATKAAEAYANELKAAVDPVFAMSQALQDVKTKQQAADDAAQKYGAHSHQARQANLDMAQSMVSAQAAATTLAAAVKTGGVSMQNARSMVDAFTKSMGLTKPQASAILGEFDSLIGKSKTLNQQRPEIIVKADTHGAVSDMQQLLNMRAQLAQGVTMHVVTSVGAANAVRSVGFATGGMVTGPGTGTSDSIPALLSDGEYVMPAEQTKANLRLLETVRKARLTPNGLALAGGGPDRPGWVMRLAA